MSFHVVSRLLVFFFVLIRVMMFESRPNYSPSFLAVYSYFTRTVRGRTRIVHRNVEESLHSCPCAYWRCLLLLSVEWHVKCSRTRWYRRYIRQRSCCSLKSYLEGGGGVILVRMNWRRRVFTSELVVILSHEDCLCCTIQHQVSFSRWIWVFGLLRNF